MTSNNNHSLRRRLQHRHILMIALGGSIGTGLFVTSGSIIYETGVLGAILAFILIGAMVYLIMASLSEMTAWMPIAGSFCKYSRDFVGNAFGLTMGYNYFFNWAITIAVELSAASYIMQYWFPQIPLIDWSTLFFTMIVSINMLPVQHYGESEYWLSIIKVLAVIGFLVIGTLLITGIIGHHATHPVQQSAAHQLFNGGWKSWLATLMVVGFSFQGTELVGVTAGEAQDPERSIPKAARNVFWRILIFYVLTMIVIGLAIPSHDPRLLHADTQHITMSPFSIVFIQAGLQHTASIMNFIILIAVLSACNSDMYAATRILWHLAEEGDAPRCFLQTNRFGVPIYALLMTAVFGGFVFLSSLFGSGVIFFWLVNISSLAGFIAWFGISLSHYRFRQQFIAAGNDPCDLPYRAKFHPAGTIICMISCIIIIAGQVLVLVNSHQLTPENILATYITIPFLMLIWLWGRAREKRRQLALEL